MMSTFNLFLIDIYMRNSIDKQKKLLNESARIRSNYMLFKIANNALVDLQAPSEHDKNSIDVYFIFRYPCSNVTTA
jgi:hypothetical protein